MHVFRTVSVLAALLASSSLTLQEPHPVWQFPVHLPVWLKIVLNVSRETTKNAKLVLNHTIKPAVAFVFVVSKTACLVNSQEYLAIHAHSPCSHL